MKYPVARPVFRGNERKYLLEAFDSTWISSMGKFIDAFEAEFAAYCGTRHGLSCSNGTVALHLALLALEVGPGDEVVVPTFTYVATANAVRYCGATPVFVDCRADTWNIDETLLESAITPRTKAIIVVHLYGHPCEMASIQEVAKRYNLKVIEDAAEAHGSICYLKPGAGVKAGSLGDLATFSLFGNKIITSGEGGIITTDDDELAEKIKILKDQGMSRDRRYWFPILGYNYRLTNLQAAIALAQLEQIDWHLEQRRKIAGWYNSFLDNSPFLQIPCEKENVKHAFWMYSVTLKEQCRRSRDEVMRRLAAASIDTRPFFYPIHQLPPYFEEKYRERFPVADDISLRGFNLPTFSDLSEKAVEEISTELLVILQSR